MWQAPHSLVTAASWIGARPPLSWAMAQLATMRESTQPARASGLAKALMAAPSLGGEISDDVALLDGGAGAAEDRVAVAIEPFRDLRRVGEAVGRTRDGHGGDGFA